MGGVRPAEPFRSFWPITAGAGSSAMMRRMEARISSIVGSPCISAIIVPLVRGRPHRSCRFGPGRLAHGPIRNAVPYPIVVDRRIEQIGRESCRESGCQYGKHMAVAEELKKKETKKEA